ncbi:MAG TPA: TRAP transporter substrate-binding protein DctP [Candidatus Sulfotelmatobacter sp.]|nr:TRAP transporter substrate-binding protein DctP [Candidatus Sulfotelmatobacter sp.]
MQKSKLTRRDFLKASSLATAGVLGGVALSSRSARAASAPGPVLELKFAEIQPAQGIYARYETKFGKLLEERTGGAVKLALFAGGALGGEKDVMEGLRLGSVHVGLMGLTLMPFLDVLSGPYIFRDEAHARKVLDGEIGKSWQERVLKESGGLRLIDYVYFGPRQLTTKRTPGRTPAELKGLKIRVQEIPIHIAIWKALGANPVPMAWPEVFTGLQQGTIEAQENPLELVISNSLFEVQKYATLTAHVRPHRFLLMNDAVFKKMTPEQQKIFVDTWKGISKEVETEYIASDQKYIETLKAKGMTIVQPDINAYKEATKDVWKEFMPKAWGPGVYEKVEAVK